MACGTEGKAPCVNNTCAIGLGITSGVCHRSVPIMAPVETSVVLPPIDERASVTVPGAATTPGTPAVPAVVDFATWHALHPTDTYDDYLAANAGGLVWGRRIDVIQSNAQALPVRRAVPGPRPESSTAKTTAAVVLGGGAAALVAWWLW